MAGMSYLYLLDVVSSRGDLLVVVSADHSKICRTVLNA